MNRRIGYLAVLLVLVLTQIACAAEDTIVIKHVWWGGNPDNVWQVAKEQFEQEHPNIVIELVPGVRDDMIMYSASGLVDTMVVDAPWFAEFVERGMLLPLDSLLEASGGRAYLEEDFWPGSYRWLERGDARYGLPYVWAQSEVLFYNKNVAAEMGLQYPDENWTWDDLLAQAKKLTTVDKRWGIDFARWGRNGGSLNWLLQYNGAGYTDSQILPTRSNLSDPKTLKAAEFWVSLVAEHRVARSDSVWDVFEQAKSAMEIGWWGQKGDWRNLPFDYDFTTVPFGPDAGDDLRCASAMHGLCIASSSPHPEAAFQWLQFLLSSPIMTLGTAKGGGIPTRVSVATNPEWLDADGHNNAAALTALTYGVPHTPLTSAWQDIVDILQEPVARAFKGEASITAVLREFDEIVDDVIQGK
ncbi:MAG: extracellular solute-binding protein [Limnochordia bacterium]|jgi:multiple sugar transport system substrate-binding protein|nr:extracellular solute-binding protein [Limnochordia bacterium]